MHRASISSRSAVVVVTVALALASAVQAAPLDATLRDAAPAPPERPAARADARAPGAWTATAPSTSSADALGDGLVRDLQGASIRQLGPDLVVGWRLHERLGTRAVTVERPLCVRIGWRSVWQRQACLVGELLAAPVRVSSLVTSGSSVIERAPQARTWRSRDRRSVFVQLPIASLAAPMLEWQVSWSVRSAASGCTVELGCVDITPLPTEQSTLRPRRWAQAGCTARAPWRQRLDASSSGPRRVALTFDDGPAAATVRILRTLRELDAPATFFVLGIQVRAEPQLARRIVAEGHEIGSHSWEHDYLPDRADQRSTLNYIEHVTGYRPCTFRPPYGALSPEELADARALRTNTINWDVDTNDWRGGSSSSIAAHVLGYAHTGSIVLMHDGGGGGSRTAGAVDSMVRGLRARGYELVTVRELLGLAPRWKYAA